MSESKLTLIIGATAKPERYAYLAKQMLQEYEHDVLLYNPHGGQVDELPVADSLDAFVGAAIDTVTLYVRPQRLEDIFEQIINLQPKRIIFNPGTEDDQFSQRAQAAGIQALNACTLVMLRSGQY